MAIYDNPDKSSHEVYHLKPAQGFEVYYELIVIIILVPAIVYHSICLVSEKTKKFKSKTRCC